jgi:cell division protein FtsB
MGNVAIPLSRSPWMRLVVFLVVTTVFIYFLVIGIQHLFRYNSFKYKSVEIQEVLSKEKKINTQLKTKLNQMASDSYWELLIRKRLGYVNRNENVYKYIYTYEK